MQIYNKKYRGRKGAQHVGCVCLAKVQEEEGCKNTRSSVIEDVGRVPKVELEYVCRFSDPHEKPRSSRCRVFSEIEARGWFRIPEALNLHDQICTCWSGTDA